MKNIFFSTCLAVFFLMASGVLSATERCLLPRLFRPAAPATPIVEAPPVTQPVLQPVVMQPYVPSVVYTAPVYTAPLASSSLVPTTQVVSLPVVTERIVLTEPTIPVRISTETVQESLVSYDMPYTTSVSDSVITTFYEPVSSNSMEIAEVHALKNRIGDEETVSYSVSMPVERSGLTILQPLQPSESEQRAEIQGSAYREMSDPETVKNAEREEETVTEESDVLANGATESKFPEVPEKSLVLRPAISEEELNAILTGADLSEPKKDDAIRLPIPPPAPTILRGQSPMDLRGAMTEALNTRPQLPQGLPSQSVIPEMLLNEPETASDVFPPLIDSNSSSNSGTTNSGKGDELKGSVSTGSSRTNGVLLIATIVSIVITIYVLMLAFDYYQRWMQSLSARSDRYAGSWNDGCGLSFSSEGDLYDGASYLGISPSFGKEFSGLSKD